MKNTNFINKREFERVLKKVISEDRLFEIQKNELENFGFTFYDICIRVDFLTDKEYSMALVFYNPKITNRLLSRYNLEEVEFDYNDKEMKIDIFKITHNEFIEDRVKLSSIISKEIGEIKEFNEVSQDLTYKGVRITNLDDMIEKELENNTEKIKEIKKEIEDTINSKLELLKADIDDMVNKIKNIIDEYTASQENKKFSLISAIKNFKNSRIISNVKHNLKLNYQRQLLEKKLKIKQINEKISNISYISNLTKLGQIIIEKQMLLSKKSLLKQEFEYLDKSKKIIYTKIEELVDSKNQEYILELLSEVDNIEDVVINEIQLLKYCIPEYNEIIASYIIN